MKKLLLVVVLLAGIVISAVAQSSPASTAKFSVAVDLASPNGNGSAGYSFGIGGSLKYELPVSNQVMFTMSGGYESFMVKSELTALGYASSTGFVPLKAGLKWYINNGFFAEGQAGATFSTESGGGTLFASAIGLGYTFDSGFEAGVRYEGWAKRYTFGQLALQVAYRF